MMKKRLLHRERGLMPLSFMRNVRAPELMSGLDWIGADPPPRMSDLAGRFVLLDFWTAG